MLMDFNEQIRVKQSLMCGEDVTISPHVGSFRRNLAVAVPLR